MNAVNGCMYMYDVWVSVSVCGVCVCVCGVCVCVCVCGVCECMWGVCECMWGVCVVCGTSPYFTAWSDLVLTR